MLEEIEANLGHALEIQPVVAMLGKQRDRRCRGQDVGSCGRQRFSHRKPLSSRAETGDASLVNILILYEPTGRAALRTIHPCPNSLVALQGTLGAIVEVAA